MIDLEKIFEIDSNIFYLMEKSLNEVAISFSKSDIPNVGRSVLSFIARTESIKEAIFILSEEGNVYAIKILLRSLFEHLLKCNYIIFRYGLEKKDDVGLEFYKYCDLSEAIQYIGSYASISEILGHEVDRNELYQSYINTYPELKQTSKRELKRKSDKFQYKSIINYIINQFNDFEENSEFNFLLEIIPNYSVLSSFVHGGPLAEKEMRKNHDDDWIKSEIFKDIVLTLSITTGIKMMSFIIASKLDKKFVPILNELNNCNKIIGSIKKYDNGISA
ncbi:hypothetical protein JXQ70_10050 [bacterium]|nr:hypothetical protein [bacterium]